MITDAVGRRVRTLVARRQSAGFHTVIWDGTDDLGRRVASGVYVYRLRAGDWVQTRKMVLVE